MIEPVCNLYHDKNDSTARPSGDTFVLVPTFDELIETLPSTRYYGSKKKLISWLYQHFRSLKFDTVLDVFGGTASVSRMFQLMRKSVFYHDGFHFNQDIAKAVLNDSKSISRSEFVDFLESIDPCTGVVSRQFKGKYFLDSENEWIDGCVRDTRHAALSDDIQALIKYTLYQACLKKRPFNLFHRANLNLRTNRNITRSFGNFTTWEKSFSEHMLVAYDELADIKHGLGQATVLSPSDASDVESGFDLVYIDPPYVSSKAGNNRDNYWRRYHFLEGLSQYNAWESQILEKDNLGMMLEPEHFSDWSSLATFQDRLFQLISKHSKSIVALSYVTNAFPHESEIQAYFEVNFKSVSIHSRDYNHALSKTKKRELLFVGHPK